MLHDRFYIGRELYGVLYLVWVSDVSQAGKMGPTSSVDADLSLLLMLPAVATPHNSVSRSHAPFNPVQSAAS